MANLDFDQAANVFGKRTDIQLHEAARNCLSLLIKNENEQTLNDFFGAVEAVPDVRGQAWYYLASAVYGKPDGWCEQQSTERFVNCVEALPSAEERAAMFCEAAWSARDHSYLEQTARECFVKHADMVSSETERENHYLVAFRCLNSSRALVRKARQKLDEVEAPIPTKCFTSNPACHWLWTAKGL